MLVEERNTKKLIEKIKKIWILKQNSIIFAVRFAKKTEKNYLK
jgi:hypothetical protein